MVKIRFFHCKISSFTKASDQDNEMLLTVSQDGYVMKYTLTNTPVLIGHQQMRLIRSKANIEDVVEVDELPANR